MEDEIAIRVLICDDVEELRDVYRLWFTHEADIDLVGEARNGAEVISLTDQLLPDVVLLDIQMPGKDGMAALDEIVRRHPQTKVIMLSGLEGPDLAVRAAQLGADYIKKGTDLAEVADRIRGLAGSPQHS